MENSEGSNTNTFRKPEPIPFYSESPVYAREHGELEQYRASARENSRCIRAITGLIRDSYDGWRLNLPEERIRSMAEDYGEDRFAFLVANSIHCASYDRRYSRKNREWAESRINFANFSGEYEQYRLSAANAHPGLIDMFATKWREMEERAAEKLLSKEQPAEKMPQDKGEVRSSAEVNRPKR